MLMFRKETASASLTAVNEDFRNAVLKGLSAPEKYIPSRFFYDETGDDLFRKIMTLPEYYPTRCEAEILGTYGGELLRAFGTSRPFQLIELGAGDGMKTRILLRHFSGAGARFTYIPTDISTHVLDLLVNRVRGEIPGLELRPVAGEYQEAIRAIHQDNNTRKAVLFLGSSIGNFNKREAATFLKTLAASLSSDDRLLVGFDLKKDPDVIFRAYSDQAGVTRDFNFNLLHRMNRELGAEFRVANFRHYPVYDPASGEMKSYLMSTRKQQVRIATLDRDFSFEAWETIQTEISAKYSVAELYALAAASGFKIEALFFDSKNYYADVLFSKNETDEQSGTRAE